jgi:hypothetical protein
MPYGDEISRYPSMKGVALDLPFVKFRYVKVDKNETEPNEANETKYLSTISSSVPSQDTQSSNVRRVVYTREAVATTLGMDPMVSNASVIHELVYGRNESSFTATLTQTAVYPAVKEPARHSLDLVV